MTPVSFYNWLIVNLIVKGLTTTSICGKLPDKSVNKREVNSSTVTVMNINGGLKVDLINIKSITGPP